MCPSLRDCWAAPSDKCLGSITENLRQDGPSVRQWVSSLRAQPAHRCRTPPPAVAHRFLTRQRMTQRASWIERSASSSTSLLEPQISTDTVWPTEWQPVIWEREAGSVVLHPLHE